MMVPIGRSWVSLRMGGRAGLLCALSLTAACGDAQRMTLVDGRRLSPGPETVAQPSWDAAALDDDASRTEALCDDFERRLEASHATGGFLVVIEDGEVLVERGFGNVGPGGGAVTNETLFLLASVSKVFVGLASLAAADQGLWDLDAPIDRYVSGADPAITARLALSHQAGVPDTSACEEGQDTPTDWAAAHAGDAVWSPPGALFNYSNAGFALAGAALESASGERLPSLVRELVLVPAGATSATYAMTGGSAPRALGQNTSLSPERFACGLVQAAGGVWASARDMTALLGALVGTTAAFSDDLRAQLTSPQVSTSGGGRVDYGHGVFLERYGEELVAYHLGGVPGFGAGLLFIPARRFGVGFAANAPDFVPFLHETVALFAPDLERMEPAPDLEALSDYAGVYADPRGQLGEFRVEVDVAGVTLVPLGEHAIWPLPLEATLWPDAAGKPRYFASRLGVAVRRDASPSDE
jgi:CubicO group peptidase (beta-lactamase class C family)